MSIDRKVMEKLRNLASNWPSLPVETRTDDDGVRHLYAADGTKAFSKVGSADIDDLVTTLFNNFPALIASHDELEAKVKALSERNTLLEAVAEKAKQAMRKYITCPALSSICRCEWCQLYDALADLERSGK